MTLSELIERVEKLDGPSREVDREIMSRFYRYEKRHIGATCWDAPGDTCCPGARHLDSVWVDPATDKWRTTARDGFEFTASLDVAIALTEQVLPDASRTIRKRFRTTEGRIEGHKYDAQVTGGDVCEGFNEATALVSATLRALSAQERDDDR